MDFEFKENYKFDDLVKIVKTLRMPGGCSWDIEQTHASIRKNLIEETYEVCEAIDEESPAHLREELGDLLLQVVFHTCIEDEKGVFNIDDVSDEICKKLIVRHPHVFGDVKVDSTEQILDNWDKIKMKTKSQSSCTEVLESVCKALPALMRSEKLYSKAKKAGFCSESDETVLCEISDTVDYLKSGASPDEKIVGKLLFDVVKLAKSSGQDAEQCLARCCDDFISEVKKSEQGAK